MSTFDTFYQSLTSDEQWFELLRAYKDETIRKAVEKVYAACVADKTVDIRPMSENRKHVYNILCVKPGDKPVGKPWQVIEAEKIEAKEKAELEAQQIITYTKEHADKCAAEALEIIRNSKMINAVPKVTHKQAVEEGGWLPKKDAPYPVTSKEEAYAKDRHLAYIVYAYEPRTAEKRPGVVSEEEFNLSYDQKKLDENGF